MKKNSIIKAISVLALAGAITVFAGCRDTSTSETPVNGAAVKTTAKIAESSISLEKAIEIALSHAGIADKEKAYFKKAQIDNNNKIQHYDIEFKADGKEYEYEIAVSNGKILENDVDKSEKATAVNPHANNNKETTTSAATPNAGYISVDDAMQIALNNLGADKKSSILSANFDGDDRIPHYDITVYSEGYEYEYEINAVSGAIIEKDVDREFDANKPNVDTSKFIGKEKAKEKAFAHAGIKASDVRRAEVELDTDDGTPHYDVEFVSGKFEYEYRINAETGNVITSVKELND